MHTGMHIGTTVEKLDKSLPAITKAIQAILATQAGDEVKKAAIAALSSAFTVQNVNVSNVTIDGGGK